MEPATISITFDIIMGAVGVATSLYAAYKHVRAQRTLKAIQNLQAAGATAILAIEKLPMPANVRNDLKRAIQEGSTLLDVEGSTWAPFVDDVVRFLDDYQDARGENVQRAEQIAHVIDQYTVQHQQRLQQLALQGAHK